MVKKIKFLLFLIPLFLMSCGDNNGGNPGIGPGPVNSGDENTSGSDPLKPDTPANYVISSPTGDANGVSNAGSIQLIDGATGEQIGETIAGSTENDQLGSSGITTLPNGNIVIASENHDVDGVVDAGSIMIIDGETGEQIGSTIAGDNPGDQLGNSGVTTLANGNIVVGSELDTVDGVAGAGSVRIINGATGEQVGATLAGDENDDGLGSSGITPLGNGNFAVASENDNVNGVRNSGSVRIINGETGAQIGSIISGDNTNDKLGSSSVTSLGNGNFVIASSGDDVGDLTDVGSVRIIDGTTGDQIGALISGKKSKDQLGSSSVTSLGNGSFVIASQNADIDNVINAGSVMIIDGATGEQMGATISGDNTGDRFGSSSVTSLGNGSFVIASELDNVEGVTNCGSVMIVNGTTGEQVGALIAGGDHSDLLGSSSVTALTNGNFVIASAKDDVDGVVDAGSIMIINGTTGEQIGSTISGENPSDQLGSSSITALTDGNFTITENDDADGSSIRTINGTTGEEIDDNVSEDDADEV